ncbi:MAG: heme A synthase [Betaproteobacteria bacterium]|jgi:cytochrome c oxidase assembly protein subunit 15|nr:heme A synthase [Betaproteobacteria bacterium]NBR98243.1 heme A synthase [Betaproteobacteria bacterium]NBY52524.1 heme A synthase [Betaproteobacteria bacterium]NCA23160.1 heme A synthase [Betaproteobacteria bacterium]NCU84536.1 heme A synthase [Betaproteobacteria bacterium]
MFALASRLAALMALCVVVLGAYVRIHDAGLGCPDWPGCYGQLLGVPEAAHELAAAQAAYPQAPVEAGKAWKEMAHRYLAGSLGLLILGLTVIAWRNRLPERGLLSLTVLVVAAQATLGMLTVTELLRPGIVTLHLLGGMTTLALLTASCAQQYSAGHNRIERLVMPAPHGLVKLALAVLILQLALGGWVSTNYAGLACNGFPDCNNSWWPAMQSDGFDLTRALHLDANGQPIAGPALVAIQMAHRVGAAVVAAVLLLLGVRLAQRGSTGWSRGVLLLVAVQIGLGIANVLLHLPVPLAVAHNAVAALLLMTLVSLLVLSRPHRERLVFRR